MEKILKGISISKGIALATPYFIEEFREEFPDFHIEKENIDHEISRFRDALVSSKKDLQVLQKKEEAPEVVAILDTHLEMLQDPLITTEIEEKIRSTCKNSESIFMQVISDFKTRISQTKDNFFQERVRDVTDISKRVLSHLRPFKTMDISSVESCSILLAKELVPSSIAEARASEILGFVTELGGISSHSAIIAKAKGIPFISGIAIDELKDLEIYEMIIDGYEGLLIINPSALTKEKYVKLQKDAEIHHKMLQEESCFDSETIDGYPVRIYGNVENIEDIDLLLQTSAAGVGLVRSEYLFLSNNRFPTEEEQFRIYREILAKLSHLPVIIRIFDVGGDKKIKGSKDPYSDELNPVLGCRAIRFLLRHPEIFRDQIRALLRASVYGDLHILVPMISDLSEILEVKKVIQREREYLLKNGVRLRENIPLGCMIEVPSCAIMADEMAKEVDFLSIGSNDLLQYIAAADRSNPHIEYLHSPAHPSLLRLLRLIISAASKQKKRLILCGEVASDPKFIPLLLGLGIREFSTAARNIAQVKHTVRSSSIIEAYRFAEKAFDFATMQGLSAFIEEYQQQ